MNRRELIVLMLQAAVAAAAEWSPQFLTREENETLTVLGERIIPGSAAAQCNRVIDLVMTVETLKVREQLRRSIAAFDEAARTRHGKIFRELTPDMQDALLLEASRQEDPDAPFAVVKEWIADTYWSSREGLRELGWNGQVAWSSFEGCASS